ncbi:hypothetical protein SAMN05216296_0015 [Pseudomonas pohangensis]|uniref:Uncharacterized protein n=1 Tax=Pseudomonas pohangensis TaxID=364197 RepID=A0A1H2DUM6_9PSED|nr:hypothetical protein [Pseudomonas pohangensis]SDT86533.1 hypothetical protein SAMN05216296_0015 [Pseudomonas pohangensis]
MKTPLIYTIVLSATLAAPSAFSDESAAYLFQSCQEVISIFAQFNEQDPLAPFTTSREEAMRAGYCQGVVDEYRRHHYRCSTNNWFEQAQKIAEVTPNSPEANDLELLLELSCAR